MTENDKMCDEPKDIKFWIGFECAIGLIMNVLENSNSDSVPDIILDEILEEAENYRRK